MQRRKTPFAIAFTITYNSMYRSTLREYAADRSQRQGGGNRKKRSPSLRNGSLPLQSDHPGLQGTGGSFGTTSAEHRRRPPGRGVGDRPMPWPADLSDRPAPGPPPTFRRFERIDPALPHVPAVFRRTILQTQTAATFRPMSRSVTAVSHSRGDESAKTLHREVPPAASTRRDNQCSPPAPHAEGRRRRPSSVVLGCAAFRRRELSVSQCCLCVAPVYKAPPVRR